MILSRNMLKRVGESRHPCLTPTVVRNQSPMLLLKEDCTSGLVIEVYDDSDKVGADVVLIHGCPQSCMPNPIEGLLEVYEDMVEVLLVLNRDHLILPRPEHPDSHVTYRTLRQ